MWRQFCGIRVLTLVLAGVGLCVVAGCNKPANYKLKVSEAADPESRFVDVLDDLSAQNDAHVKAGKPDGDDQAWADLFNQAKSNCEKELQARGETSEAAKRLATQWAAAQERRHYNRRMVEIERGH